MKQTACKVSSHGCLLNRKLQTRPIRKPTSVSEVSKTSGVWFRGEVRCIGHSYEFIRIGKLYERSRKLQSEVVRTRKN